MTARKIELMHKLFGKRNEYKCKTCNHLHKYLRNAGYYKCDAYGITHSEASDWRISYIACGLYNKQYDGNYVVSLVKPDAKEEVQIEGQMSLEEIQNESC